LTEEQGARLQAIVRTMKSDAAVIGKSLVEAERDLDRSFKHRKATAASIDKQTAEIGRLMGQLRAVHLKAHLQATALLTPGQIQAYDVERGYAANAGTTSRQ
jgi:hypothetical protein